jgi:hypothetical protein
LKIFQKFFSSEIKVLRPVEIHKFELFSSISWGLCNGTKGEKVLLFGFSTGSKSEKLNFYSSNIINSPLVPVLNPKSTTFSHLVPVQSSQEIEEKNSLVYFGYLYRP